MHQPPGKIPKALHVTVDGQDDSGRRHLSLRRPDHMVSSRLDAQHRGVLEHLHVPREPCANAPNVGRRLNDRCARRMRAAGVVGAAGDLLHLRGVQRGIGLAEGVQVPFELPQRRKAMPVGRGVILAAGLEMLEEPVFLGSLAREADARAVHADLFVVVGGGPGVILSIEIVRQVDHEAGIASGRTPADPLRLQYHDLVGRAQLRQTARGGEAGETCADHHPICRQRSRELARRRRGRKQLVPSGSRKIHWNTLGVAHAHRRAEVLISRSRRRPLDRTHRSRPSSARCTDRGHGSTCRDRRNPIACIRRTGWSRPPRRSSSR